MNAISKQTKVIRAEIEDDQEDYLLEHEDLMEILRSNNKTLDQLVALVDDKVD